MGLFNRDSGRFWLALGGVLGLTAVAQAQQANVTGRVTDQASGHPLGGARVTIVGTSLIAQTNAEGRYSIARVPAGQATVRASAVGYAAASRALTVNPGESAVADLTLALRSEEHTSELQSRENLVCRLLLEKKKKIARHTMEPTRID